MAIVQQLSIEPLSFVLKLSVDEGDSKVRTISQTLHLFGSIVFRFGWCLGLNEGSNISLKEINFCTLTS